MKIIASDFDGTINYQGKISEEDKIAIQRFRQAGNKFGVVTGRDVELASFIRPENGFEYDFLICCTGAVIRDGTGKILSARKGKVGDFFEDIIKKAMELNAGTFNISDMMLRAHYDVTGNIVPQYKLLKEFTHANNWFYKTEDAIAFTEYVNTYHKNDIYAHRNGNSVDMPPLGVTKVTGIYDYASRFDSPEVYTVGDNINDIPMIKEFSGFAVSNALPEVKAAAKHQCDRVCDMIEFLMKEGN